jgi:hypothetical protein
MNTLHHGDYLHVPRRYLADESVDPQPHQTIRE